MVIKNSLIGKNILITCGPTWIPIDQVRVLSNCSSGELGQTLTRLLLEKGAKVTLLEGAVANPWKDRKAKVIPFRFFNELADLLSKELQKNYAVVIHAAAVSDFQLKKPFNGKLSSDLSELKLKLIQTPKLIDKIKKRNPRLFLVGFKLKPFLKKTKNDKSIRDLFRTSGCDLVVVNTLDKKKYCGYIINFKNQILAQARSRKQMAQALVKCLNDYAD